MPYRNGTYVAFHANGTSDPSQSDMKYYNTLKMWKVREESDFEFVDSHDKATAVRDSSSRARLAEVLKARLRNSKNMILILGETTRFDRDWVPMEIEYAIDQCDIPVIVTYVHPDYLNIPCPPTPEMEAVWPAALRDRINNGTAKAIHIPFRQAPIRDALGQFDLEKFPKNGGRGYYNYDAYRSWGLVKETAAR